MGYVETVISVVIPAHNEERTLARCLDALLADAHDGELEILVVCNGCSDRTHDVALSYGPPVRVLEADRASKAAALNLGDAQAQGFPRVFVDADVELSTAALRRIAAVLAGGEVLAAAPRLDADLSASPWSVRAYYRYWMALPYVRESLVGSGVYAISKAGRERFERFPDAIADDLFVRNLFEPHERRSIPDCSFRIRAPRTLRDLVSRKIRVFVGNKQLAARSAPRATGESEWLGALRHDPALLRYLPVYLFVGALAHLRAAVRVWRGDYKTWDRDESTRQEIG